MGTPTRNFQGGSYPMGESLQGGRNFQQSYGRNRSQGFVTASWDFVLFLHTGQYGFPGDPDYDPTLGFRTNIPSAPSIMDEISGSYKDYTTTPEDGGDSPIGRYFGPVTDGVAAATFRWINAVPVLGGFYNAEILFFDAVSSFSGADGSTLKAQIISLDGSMIEDVETFTSSDLSNVNTFSFDSRTLFGGPTYFYPALLVTNFNGFPGASLDPGGGFQVEFKST